MKKYFCFVFFFFPLLGFAQFTADFENGNLNEWQQYPASDVWSATSATGKIIGNFSLRHIGSSGAATDYISAPIEAFKLEEGRTVWRFHMKYNYNPTGTNKWAIMLMVDTLASEWASSGRCKGYAVGVNCAAGITDKRLCLYAVNNGVYEEIIKTVINWNDSIGTGSTTVVAFEISRSAAGEWAMHLTKSANFDNLKFYGAVTDTRYLKANYFGAINTYTSSSAGAQKLWLDDITIVSSVFPSKMLNVIQHDTKTLLVNFTKPLSIEGLQDNKNYTLTCGSTIINPQTIDIKSPTQLQVNFSELLPRGNAHLAVEKLRDKNNNPVADGRYFLIDYGLYDDVIINEIMAAPVPAVGLPEVAYIELYNRRDVDVSVNGWKMEYITTSSGSTTSGNIGNTTIAAHGYLILCASASLDVMREYGAATSISYISSLTKSGKTLSLKNAAGQLLSHLTYSDKWIVDDAKRAGGWSLEKIDVNNFSENATNWTVSTDEIGGTPGRQNSVQALNPDTDAPVIVDFKYIDNQTVQLTFNEFFDTLKAKNPLCYIVNNSIGQADQIVFSSAKPEQVELHFTNVFTEGSLYTLSIGAPFCDLAGNEPRNLQHTFGNLFSLKEGEIVINEVLFNPYPNGVDFVEIYNRSNKIFDLRQVKIANRDKNNTITSIHIVSQHYFLKPNEYAVFTTSIEALRQFYSVPFLEKVIVLNGLPSYPDDAGCVVLLSDKDIVVDEFFYTEKMHNGFIAKPEGVSLERVNPERPSNERANWQSAAQDAGFATPTYRNSQYNLSEQKDTEISLPYDVFSPDGDGYNDVLYIDYNLPTSGYVATITIYDAQGRLVKEMEKKTLLGISGRFAWDGMRYNSRKAVPGMYVVFIELFDLNGNIKRIKKSCALAMR